MKLPKRFLALFFMFMLIFTVVLPVTAFGADCGPGTGNHTYVDGAKTYYYTSSGSSQHAIRAKYIQKCIKCGLTNNLDMGEGYESHNSSGFRDTGHSGTKHTGNRYCSKCNYNHAAMTPWACSGSPHVLPL